MRLVGALSFVAVLFFGCGDQATPADVRDAVDARETAIGDDVETTEIAEISDSSSETNEGSGEADSALETTPDSTEPDTFDLETDASDAADADALDDASDTLDDSDVRADDSDTLDDTRPELDGDGSACGTPINSELYLDLSDLDGDVLRDALHAFVSDAAVGFSYDAGRNLMWGITDDIDVDADNEIECVYTGVHVPADGTRSPGQGALDMSTEHSWPRGDGAALFPAEGDVHHLFPVLSTANNVRASYQFGDTSCGHDEERACPWSQGGSQLGPAIDGRNPVFEVRPERRGDIARAHFYFAVRYALTIPLDEEATLRRWHCEDPPDAIERKRNDDIELHQHNRNPFIDQPQLVDHLSDY